MLPNTHEVHFWRGEMEEREMWKVESKELVCLSLDLYYSTRTDVCYGHVS